MITTLIAWLRTSVNYVWLVAIAAYLSISAAQAFARNYQSQQETEQLQQQLVQLEAERAHLEALVVYYQTDSYKEKELRRTLLLKRPGEQVYALPESSIAKAIEEAAAAEQAKKDPRRSLPTWRQWVDYLIQGREA